jgi:hypothetical protein
MNTVVLSLSVRFVRMLAAHAFESLSCAENTQSTSLVRMSRSRGRQSLSGSPWRAMCMELCSTHGESACEWGGGHVRAPPLPVRRAHRGRADQFWRIRVMRASRAALGGVRLCAGRRGASPRASPIELVMGSWERSHWDSLPPWETFLTFFAATLHASGPDAPPGHRHRHAATRQPAHSGRGAPAEPARRAPRSCTLGGVRSFRSSVFGPLSLCTLSRNFIHTVSAIYLLYRALHRRTRVRCAAEPSGA